MKNLRVLIQPEHLLALPTFLVSLAIALFLHFIDAAHNVKDHYLIRFLLIISIHTALFAVAWVFTFFLRKRMSLRSTATIVVLAIYIGSSVRGFLMYFGLDVLNIDHDVSFRFRMQSSIVTVGTVILIATIAYALVITQSRSNSNLLLTQASLYKIRNRAIEDFSSFDEKFRDSIASQLSDSIINFSKAEATQSLSILRSVITEVIRPLSAFLEKETSGFNQELRPTEKFRVNWLNVSKRSFQISEIRVLPPLLLLILFGSSPLSTDYTTITALKIIGTILSLNLLILMSSKYIFQIVSDRVRNSFQPLLFLITLIIPGESIALQANYFIRNTERPQAFTYIAPGTFMFIGILLAVLNATKSEVGSVKAELNVLTNELRWEAARAQELNRQQQRLLTFILHGQIQASMEASFLKLQSAISSHADEEKIKTELTQSMNSAVELLYSNANTPESLESLFEKVNVMWSEISLIDYKIPEGLILMIESDSVCHVTVSDLVTELTFNAIKHASATEIQIEITETPGRTITLTVKNNGSSYLDSGGRGVGSKLLDQSTISWNRSTVNGKTVTICLLPFINSAK